jgi:multimeric flavodoxin WrbA
MEISIRKADCMKIVIINGSPRKNGATNKILNQFNKNIIKEVSDVEINYINLIDENPAFCLGCQNCYKTGKCIIKTDRMEEIHDLIEQSDGIIFGSPTYSCNVSGLFKVFHSRVHMTDEQLLTRKPCIVVTTYENAMGNQALSIMRNMVIIAGGYMSGALIIRISFNENPLNDSGIKKINNIINRFIRNLSKNKPSLFSKIFSYIVINIFFKPFVMKNKEYYNGVIESWKKKGLMK